MISVQLQRPEKVIKGNPEWSPEENEILREFYPRLEITIHDIMALMPWRSMIAIYAQTSRLGLTKESLAEAMRRQRIQ